MIPKLSSFRWPRLVLRMNHLYEYRIGKFSPARFLERIKDLKFLRHRRQRSFPQFPLSMSLEVTSHCTQRCNFCPCHIAPDAMDRGLGHMSWDVFQKAIDESVRYGKRRTIFFYKDGESLLNPLLGKMIRYAKEKRAAETLALTSNGTVLTEQNSKMLVESGLDELVISIDAADAETYRIIRNSDAYDKVIRNVRRFFEIRKAMGARSPYVKMKMVVCDQNRGQERKFIEQWEKLADEVLIVRDLNTWNGASSTVNEFVGASETYKSLRAFADERNPKRYPCDRLWYQFEVYYNGNCSPCICDWNETYVLGNLKEQSIYSMWHGEKLKALRTLHVDGQQDRSELCKNCDRWALYNMGDWLSKNREKALATNPEREIFAPTARAAPNFD